MVRHSNFQDIKRRGGIVDCVVSTIPANCLRVCRGNQQSCVERPQWETYHIDGDYRNDFRICADFHLALWFDAGTEEKSQETVESTRKLSGFRGGVPKSYMTRA